MRIVKFFLLIFIFSVVSLYAKDTTPQNPSLNGDLNKPSKIIDTYAEKVINVFKQTDTNKPRQTWESSLKDKLLSLAKEVVDFNVMARMSLGTNWKKLNSAQQKEFVDLFIKMLENTYFTTIVDHMEEIKNYNKDNIKVMREIPLSKIKTEVQTIILYEDKKIPVNYKMAKINNAWKCYDVYIEGISLVQNYREQFNELMNKMTSDEIITFLRNKANKAEGFNIPKKDNTKQSSIRTLC